MELAAGKELFVKMVVSAWETYLTRTTKLINELTDDQLMQDTAPGRNSGKYLVGHLVAVSDHMQSLLEWEDMRYPQLQDIYIRNPDKSALEQPTLKELREYWSLTHDAATRHIAGMKPNDWFARHTAVSAQDFQKEPHRNKLNLLINRTNHLSYHYGQLIYLSKKKSD